MRTRRTTAMLAALVLVGLAWIARSWLERDTEPGVVLPDSTRAAEGPPAAALPGGDRRDVAEAPAEPAGPEPELVADAAPSAEELDLSERSRAGPPPPEGTIEVRVVRGREGLQASVELSRYTDPVVTASQLAGAREPIERRATDEAGVARFERLEAGDYAVRARLQDDLALEAHVRLRADAPGERVWLLFGEGGLRGHAYDQAGLPRADTLVALSAWLPPARLETRTGPDGAYRVAGLRSGTYSVSLPPADGTAEPADHVRVRLEAGEWKTVDLGATGAAATWRGTLRLADGSAATGPQRLTLTDLERGAERALEVDREGRFELRLRPGRYTVSAWSLGARHVLEELELPAGATLRDLRARGAELVGRTRWAPSGAATRDPVARHVQVWVESIADPRVRAFASSDGEGRYVLRGMEPGEWRVSVHPGRIQGAPNSGFTVTVTVGASRVPLDLEIETP